MKLIKLKALLITVFSLGIISAQSLEEIDLNALSTLGPDELEQLQLLSNVDDVNNSFISVPDESLLPKQSQASNKYGYDFINKTPSSLTAIGDLPIPNDYKISLRDNFEIILTGSKERRFNLDVNLDGTILFPELGAISVYGDSFGEVKVRLKNLIEQSYVGVNIDISLKNMSAKKIIIVGAVSSPGIYLVNPFSTISGALQYSGGIEEYGTLREIILIRANGEKFSFDLYDLLINGDRSNDLTVEQGDTILVNSTTKFIDIIGDVNRPMTYEYKNDEEIKDLIGFALGPKKTANLDKIALTYLDNELKTSKISEISYDEIISVNNFKNLIAINVFSIQENPELKIKVTGPLENQGFFNLPSSGKLKDLLNLLNFTSEVNPYIAVLQEGNKSTLFSLSDQTTQDLSLSLNAEIFFFNKFSNDLNQTLQKFGSNENYTDLDLTYNSLKLLNDYQLRIYLDDERIDLPFYGEISVNEIIEYLGLDTSGLYSSKTTYIAPIANLIKVEDYKNLSFKASKFNILRFRSLIDETITVTVSGEVKLPGTYTLPKSTTLKSLYELVEGITEDGDENTVIFTRDSIKERNLRILEKAKQSLNDIMIRSSEEFSPSLTALLGQNIDEESLGRISGDLSERSPLVESFYLENNDTIFIPKKIATISVIGDVMNPSTFMFDESLRLKDVISNAGGYKQTAYKRGVYVIKTNGSIEKPSGIFLKNIKLEPGDTVVVPTDYNFDQPLITVLEPITSILSNLAFSAAAIDNLRQ